MTDITNHLQLAVYQAMSRRHDKTMTLDEINLLPVFDGLTDIKKAAHSAKTSLIRRGAIRMKRRGIYEINN